MKQETMDLMRENLGDDMPLDEISTYISERGHDTDIRFLKGGYSGQAVIALKGKVIKVDRDHHRARSQRDFFRDSKGDLSLYVPRVIDDITYIKVAALWDMEDVSNRFSPTWNRFSLSESKRNVLSNYDPLPNYEATEVAKEIINDQGAKGLSEFIDHYMFVASLVHSNEYKDLWNIGPQVDPDVIKEQMYNLRDLEKTHPLSGFLNNSTVEKLLEPLQDALNYLEPQQNILIHGDFKPGNTVDGSLVDPILRKGHGAEDAIRFLTDPSLQLSSEEIQEGLNRYALYASKKEGNLEGMQAEIAQVFPASYLVQMVERLAATVKREILQPNEQKRTHILLNSAHQALTYFVRG
jgi:hypothetical protein